MVKEAGLKEGDKTKGNIPEEMLRNQIYMRGQMRTIKVGYEEKEIVVDVQRLVLLMPTNKMELLREPDELLKDDTTGHDLKELFKEAGLEEIKETKDEAPGGLIKDVTADDTSKPDKKESVEVGDETEGVAPDELVEEDLELKVELLRMTANYDFGLPGACCPGLPSDADEQDDYAADVLPRRSL